MCAAIHNIRADKDELARIRAISEDQAARDSIQLLLQSTKTDERKAALAALVAVGGPGRVATLLNFAINDGDDGVRAEAQRALMALGQSTDPKPQQD